MATKKTKATKEKIDKAELLKETEDIIYFKCTEKLRENPFKLLGDMVRHEMKETGKTIILVPYSVEVGEK